MIVRSASRPVLVRSWFVRGIGWAMMGLLVVGSLAWWLVGRSRESGSRAEKDPVREAAKTNRARQGPRPAMCRLNVRSSAWGWTSSGPSGYGRAGHVGDLLRRADGPPSRRPQ